MLNWNVSKMSNKSFRSMYDGQLMIAFAVFVIIWGSTALVMLFRSVDGKGTTIGVLMIALLFFLSFGFIGWINGKDNE